MHSLISITILVIAISFLSVISGVDVKERQNECRHYLMTYCGFQDKNRDYVDIYLPGSSDYENIYLHGSSDVKIKEILKEIEKKMRYEIGNEIEKKMRYEIGNETGALKKKANEINSIVNSTLDSAAIVKHLRTKFLKIILPQIIDNGDNGELKQKFKTSESIDGDEFGTKYIEYIYDHIKDNKDAQQWYSELTTTNNEDPIVAKSMILFNYTELFIKGMKETPVTDFCQHEITSEETYRSFFVEIANFGMPSLVKK